MGNTERKVLNGMIEHGDGFVYGTDHTGAKFINLIPFRDLPETTDAVYWVEIEGGNHEKFGPYRMYQLEVKDWSKIPQEPIRELPKNNEQYPHLFHGQLKGTSVNQIMFDEPFSVKNSDAQHRNWNKTMREIVPHYAHLYPAGLTQSEYEFDGLLEKVTKLEAQVVDLKISSKWKWVAIIALSAGQIGGVIFGW